MTQAPVATSLKTYIEELVKNNSNELRQYLTSQQANLRTICDLKKVNYAFGGRPDFTKKEQQNLYLLRYGSAYTVEYSCAYDICFKYLCSKKIRIVSIGCGAMLDYAAAYFRSQVHNKQIEYVGIDLVNWDHRDYIHGGVFLNKNLSDVDGVALGGAIDIIFLPKSLNDIGHELVTTFFNKNAKQLGSSLILVNSSRFGSGDWELANAVIEYAYSNIGYSKKRSYSVRRFENSEGESLGIWDIHDRFFIGSHVKITNDLYNMCYKREVCTERCELIINRPAMLLTTYFDTQIHCLEKNAVA